MPMRPASDVSRRINAERLLLLAWVRAILLQFAHPLIAAAVAEHSSFRGSTITAFARLRHTVDAMLAVTFASDAERDAAVQMIRTIHRRVHGALAQGCGPFAAGTRYSAEDPTLLTWVYATLVESMVIVYEELVAPLSPTDRDRYCADAAELAVALGASQHIPRSWNALRAYINDRYASGEVIVGQQALALSAALLSPVRGPLARLVAPWLALLASGLLPETVRRQYGLRWNRGRAKRFVQSMAWLRRLRRALPRFITQWNRAR
jgi:uncharacterized protein (DUF2236 family)